MTEYFDHSEPPYEGNIGPLKIVLPPDGSKNQETRIYLGKVQVATGWVKNPNRKWWEVWKPKRVRYQGIEHWTKTKQTPLNFELAPAWEDIVLRQEKIEVRNNDKED